LKFGGTSVGSIESLRQVVTIAAQTARQERTALVASAASGVTDALVAVAEAENPDTEATLEYLRERHLELASGLLGRASTADYELLLEHRLALLRQTIDNYPVSSTPDERYDLIISEGERLSTPLIAMALSEAGVSAEWVDASELIRTDNTHGDAQVDLIATRRAVTHWIATWPSHVVPIVTGFVGRSTAGEITTLGRSGSDYSAAVLAAALSASRMERWTDTDGIYTDDPNKNPDARRIACIVLETALSWNQAGRLGMHRKALDPLVELDVPVFVRCTHAPDEQGTVIIPSTDHHLYQRVAV
jgi:aspartate kinase